jgi:hypothetical protein
VRRIKCDEAKPECLKCTSTGRKCDGYETFEAPPVKPPEIPRHKYPNSIAKLPSHFRGDEQERRSFQFFYERTISEISGYFPSDFWTTLILPASHTDPAILHAAIALGSIHEMHESGDVAYPKNEKDSGSQFALQQSNKAIRHLTQSMSGFAPGSGEIILMSCILFVFLETFQRNHRAALSHLECGLKILGSWLREDSQPIFREDCVSKPDVAFIEDKLVPMFTLLDVQASGYITTRAVHRDLLSKAAGTSDEPVTIPHRFLSLEEANHSLHNLFHWMMHFTQTAQMHLSPTPGDPVPNLPESLLGKFLVAQKKNNSLLNQWLDALNVFLRDPKTKLEAKELRGVIVLKIKHLDSIILNGACLAFHEMEFDNFLLDFERMAKLAESLVKHRGQSATSPGKTSFSFDLNILAPLYHTVCRCRDPFLRRKALALLYEISPRREGVWDSEVLIAISKWAMLKEEEELGDVLGAEDVPASERIRIIDKTLQWGERKCVVKYCQGVSSPGGTSGIKEELITW